MSDPAPRDRPRVATFSFSDSLLGDTTLDPPSSDPLTSPAEAAHYRGHVLRPRRTVPYSQRFVHPIDAAHQSSWRKVA
eukprot:scaffold1762_cov128-Cylindrotheca_fusiformis.AAC.5